MSFFKDLIKTGIGRVFDRKDRKASERYGLGMYNLQRKHFLEDRKYDEKYLSRLVSGAKEAGLHPLAALGVPMATTQFGGSAPSVSTPSSTVYDSPESDSSVNDAQVEHLKAQTDFVKEQAAASRLARLKEAMMINKDSFHEINEPQRTLRLKPFGINIDTANTTDAETLESRYGELGGSILGLGNIASDVYETLKRAIRRKLSTSKTGSW